MVALALAVLFPARDGAAAAEDSRPLQLEVYINDQPTKLIGSFTQLADRRIAARRAELAELGVKVPSSGGGDDLVVIDGLGDVAYRYDEPGQKIFFTLGDERRVMQTYDLRGSSDVIAPSRADYGSVLNYTLFASSMKPPDRTWFAFSGANATVDGRFFGPFGTLKQSAILGTTTTQNLDALRLDTTWTYSNPETLLSYRAGDTISGGLAWTRPVRLGGLQVQRNFALRPDLVTLPLPAVSGSAAVPSTLDVYVNNVMVHSQEVPSGPYQVTNIPAISPAGTAMVVVRDAAGRQTQASLQFYTSPKLLKEGFVDFSVDAGVPRLLYGIESNGYVADPIASATLRGGLHDWLTVESHAELSPGFFNGGLGSVTRLGAAGILSLAGSASGLGDARGLQSYVAYDAQVRGFNFHASSLRTFGTYNDIASVTARFLPIFTAYPGYSLVNTDLSRLVANARPPKSLDTISVGLPLSVGRSWLTFGYLHLVLDDLTRSDIVTVSYSRSLFANATAFLSAFSDLSSRKNSGIFFGMSMPLDGAPSGVGPTSVSSNVTRTRSGTNVTFDAVKSMQPEPGSYGWRVRDSEGGTPYRSAAASYRSSVAQFDGYVQQVGPIDGAWAQAQGAIATMGGGVFFSNRIDDSFAVVDVGAPGVDVFYENRPAGTSNAQGQLLIPTLQSYQKNKISIDPRDLPVDAEAPTVQNVTAPADRSGVVVPFGVKTDVKAAVVILARKDGKPIAPGTEGRLESTNEPFVVGYDGRAYIKGLAAANTAVVGDGECRASFPYTAQKNSQVVIGPIVCQ